jgi:hypothetical protein
VTLVLPRYALVTARLEQPSLQGDSASLSMYPDTAAGLVHSARVGMVVSYSRSMTAEAATVYRRSWLVSSLRLWLLYIGTLTSEHS